MRASLALLTLLPASLGSAVARAQPSQDELEAARALGVAGVKLADAGDCRGAIDKLEKARELYAAPSIVARLGECKLEVGRLVDGVADLERVAGEPLAADAPRAFVEAQARARTALEAALLRLPRLTVEVIAPSSQTPSVTIDGKPLPARALGAPQRVDPGAHAIVASATGFATATREVTLAEGARETVTLELDPLDAQPPPAAGATPAAGSVTPPRSRTAAWIVLGVGAAGIAAGAALGAVAMQRKNDLETTCPAGRCPPWAAGDLDAARNAALGSTIGFGVGAAGLALGTFLLLRSGRSEPGPRAAGGAHPVRVAPWLLDRGAGLGGSF
jgi:hypothetical protein